MFAAVRVIAPVTARLVAAELLPAPGRRYRLAVRRGHYLVTADAAGRGTGNLGLISRIVRVRSRKLARGRLSAAGPAVVAIDEIELTTEPGLPKASLQAARSNSPATDAPTGASRPIRSSRRFASAAAGRSRPTGR